MVIRMQTWHHMDKGSVHTKYSASHRARTSSRSTHTANENSIGLTGRRTLPSEEGPPYNVRDEERPHHCAVYEAQRLFTRSNGLGDHNYHMAEEREPQISYPGPPPDVNNYISDCKCGNMPEGGSVFNHERRHVRVKEEV